MGSRLIRRFLLISVWTFLVSFYATNSLAVKVLLSEDFDDVAKLTASGWVMHNQSKPLGTTGWLQGNPAFFAAHTGSSTSYVAANYLNTSGTGTISNWLISPELDFSRISQVYYWTRTRTSSSFPDRMQVRISTNGASTNTGTSETDVGDFTQLATDINPTLIVGGYPDTWSLYAFPLPSSFTGRFAFRYFVTNGGTGSNSNYIAIDTLSIIANHYPIMALADAGGTINPSGNIGVDDGDNQTFTIIPDTQYRIADVEVDGVSVGAVTSYTFTNVKKPHHIKAYFQKRFPWPMFMPSITVNGTR